MSHTSGNSFKIDVSSIFWRMALILIIHFLNPDVLTFCVSLDYLDVLLCIHICLMGFAVCWFNVVSEVTYFGCCVVAFITWVGHFSVHWLNVFSEMIFFNGGEITFVVSFITKSLGENDKKLLPFFENMNIKIGLFIKDLKDTVSRHSN